MPGTKALPIGGYKRTIKGKSDAKLLGFKQIRISVPRKFLLTCYRKEKITFCEYSKMRAFFKEIEMTVNKLRHVQSIVEKMILRHQQ